MSGLMDDDGQMDGWIDGRMAGRRSSCNCWFELQALLVLIVTATCIYLPLQFKHFNCCCLFRFLKDFLL